MTYIWLIGLTLLVIIAAIIYYSLQAWTAYEVERAKKRDEENVKQTQSLSEMIKEELSKEDK